MQKEERYVGSILGLAIGDAMGMPVEIAGIPAKPVTGFRAGSWMKLQPGEWTDDTSQALCLADSLIRQRKFSPYDALNTFLRWLNEGYLSCREGKSYGCGGTTYGALREFESRPREFCGATSDYTATNGSLMRFAPVPLAYANRARQGIVYSGESSQTTHGARESIDACRYLGALIVGAVNGFSKEVLLGDHFDAVERSIWQNFALLPSIDRIASGSFKELAHPAIDKDTFARAHIALHYALWAFYHTSTFADGLLKVVNLGWDADTMGAVYGQLAGAYYGEQGIPQEWREGVAHAKKIRQFGEELFQLSAELT